jgi:membrane-associated phospholipid phosphatase
LPAYPPHSEGVEGAIFGFADIINLDHNMCPSLHVAMAVAAAYVYALHSTRPAKRFWWLWAAAIMVSTLLTHQHHVIDVLAGAVVGWGCASLSNKNAWPR